MAFLFSPFVQMLRDSVASSRANGDLYPFIYDYRDWLFENTSLKARTLDTYTRRLEWLAEWMERSNSGETLTDLTANAIINYLEELTINGRRPTTVKAYFSTIRAFTGWLAEVGVIETDPAATIRLEPVVIR